MNHGSKRCNKRCGKQSASFKILRLTASDNATRKSKEATHGRHQELAVKCRVAAQRSKQNKTRAGHCKVWG